MVKNSLTGLTVGVLQGGVSSERDISLLSGQQVLEALRRCAVKAVPIDIFTRDRKTLGALLSESGIDCAFIALHGEFGEDGTIQDILEDLEIPYTGSGPEASYRAMDKIVSKEIFLREKISTPSFYPLRRGQSFSPPSLYPVVVKPYLSGSSVGVRIVHQESELSSALEEAFAQGDKVLIEEYIPGRECTVGILEDRPLGVVEIIPKNPYYDFSAKYTDGMVEFVAPAPFSREIYRAVQDTGLQAHRVLGCRDFSRVDIRLSPQGTPFVLEVNSIPGLTSHSLLPLSARCQGIDFDRLIERMIRLALERAQPEERMDNRYGSQRQTPQKK